MKEIDAKQLPKDATIFYNQGGRSRAFGYIEKKDGVFYFIPAYFRDSDVDLNRWRISAWYAYEVMSTEEFVLWRLENA